ncbi:unnamed protein product [Microthlaspi erraticum]|uniref:CCHC-type domain-containing protein n=1 Tax=Microthlaspi erraticum TaxID=1685480 RepID=A0A6D2IN10_9BRAS|nr:unnamed protein product [Microthlaspi erraticum]
MEPHLFSDDTSKTIVWRSSFDEPINQIGTPEDAWRVPIDVEQDIVLCPESRRAAGRRRKRRYQTVEDKIRLSQGGQVKKRHMCSRCFKEGHNRATCDMPI